MTVDDLQELYGELRGSRSAPAIMDARASFLERQYSDALAHLRDAHETYSESRQRILRQDPEKSVDKKAADRDRQIRRLKRKQDKARELIEKFEEFLPQLEKLAAKEIARSEAKVQEAKVQQPSSEPSNEDERRSPDSAPDSRSCVKPDSVDAEYLQQFSKLIGDRQLEFVSSRFDFVPLTSSDQIAVGAVYLFRRKDRCVLIHAQQDADAGDDLTCVDLNNAENRVHLSRQAMVKLSSKRRLVLLLHPTTNR